jgi:hypothetical protein
MLVLILLMLVPMLVRIVKCWCDISAGACVPLVLVLVLQLLSARVLQ